MRNIATVLIPLCIALLCAVPIDSNAQWTEYGTDVCTHEFGVGAPVIISDGDGGAIIAWLDGRASPYQLYAQHVTRHGQMQWTADGMAITGSPNLPQGLSMASDGMGGAYIAWTEYRNGNNDIYMQRVDSEGNLLWTVNGIVVCAMDGSQGINDMVEDGEGGVILVWDDHRSISPGIYAQRIEPGSTAMWTSGGVMVTSAMFVALESPAVTSNGAGGAIVVWKAYATLNNWDLYAQGINADGTIKWSWLTGGALICNDASSPSNPLIETNGAGGAIIVWTDGRNGINNSDIWASMIDSGSSVWWTANGEPICTAANNQYWPDLASDGQGGAIITWEDYRVAPADVYAQRISPYGTKFWGTDGTLISGAEGHQMRPVVVPDGDGGVVIAWNDLRSWSYEIYAQRVDSGGGTYWIADGARVCSSSLILSDIYIISDCAGGAVCTWRDIRTGSDTDIFANRIEANGYWGYPAPAISGIADVPNDQGGQVTVEWASSRLDAFPDLDITHYSIWRSISAMEAAALEAGGGKIIDIDKTGELPVSSEARIIMLGEGYAWEWLSDMNSLTQPFYSYTAATLWDSTVAGNDRSHFMVAAHTATPSVFWFSDPDSCYSVDNLAPAVPLGLAGEQSYTPEGLQMTWDPNIESDLYGYRIYRGLTDDFVPGPGNFVTATPDTFSFDGGWTWDSGYFYKVSAVDIHGNESQYALFIPTEVTGDDPAPLPEATFLAQNFPNPFNPITTIRFGLNEPGHISLRIYDAAGRLVTTLIDESRPAGSYTAEWNGLGDGGSRVSSGVYFYRLRTGGFLETRKMVLLK